jgi:predicted kinase
VGPAGYLVAYQVAESNLLIGRMEIADSVNRLAVTRDAWRQVAATTSSEIIEIEVVCSDRTEHRRRVETRSVDVLGLALPCWQDVVERDYEPWNRSRIILDTAGCTILEALKELQMRINNTRFGA